MALASGFSHFNGLTHTLQVHHGGLYVNGVAQEEDFVAEKPTYTMKSTVRPLLIAIVIFFLDRQMLAISISILC